MAFLSLPFLTYIIALLLVAGLFFLKRKTPHIFFVITAVTFLLFAFAPSPTLIASFFPLVGFLFCGDTYDDFRENKYIRHAIVGSAYFFFILYFLIPDNIGVASRNYLSIIILYAMLCEYLLFKKIVVAYIPLILVCFFLVGNRSSIFLLAAFLRSKLALGVFIGVAIFFIGMTLGSIEVSKGIQFFFDEGGVLNRSYGETRGDYIDEFIRDFDFFRLSYANWNFSNIPQTSAGFYDLHNSFLTLIVRDSYLGLFKVFLWAIQILFLPLGLFISVSSRAYYDTFLLGGVNDILTYALIGTMIRAKMKYFLKAISKYK
ncbi:MAG: hypothetical protein HYU70_10085 [Bacteroidetes bacterium]|nr:hypothetical protein [Bacteroidota bacterium]